MMLCFEKGSAFGRSWKLLRTVRAGLLEIVEKVVLLSPADGLECGFAGGLGVGQVAQNSGQIGASDIVPLLGELGAPRLEKTLLRVQLLGCIILENPLSVDVLVRGADFADGRVEVRAGLQAGD